MKSLTPETAFSRAAARCSLRECCRSDFRRKFLEGGLSSSEAEAVLRRLEGEGYIDESRYARAFVHDKLAYEGWGRVKMCAALRLKGISDADISAACAEIDEEEYRGVLRRLVRQKRRALTDSESPAARQKIVRFLASRGFEANFVFSELNLDIDE